MRNSRAEPRRAGGRTGAALRSLLVKTALVAWLLLAVVLRPPTIAATKDVRTLVLRGRVADRSGWPLERVRLVLDGSRHGATSTDAQGRYTLVATLGTPRDLARAPFALTLVAERKGWDLRLADGSDRMRLELRVAFEEPGGARCELRSNHAGVVAALARALRATGAADAVADVSFLGAEGKPTRSAPPTLSAREEVPLPGVPSPRARTLPTPGTPLGHEPKPAPDSARSHAAPTRPAPAVATPKPSVANPPAAGKRKPAPAPAAAPRTATVAPTAPQRMNPPPTAAPPHATPPEDSSLGSAPDSCRCRIEGTLEVRSERPLSQGLRVIVRLRDAPGVRDTVRLFMGSPRPFVLRAAPCGTHVLDAIALARQRYALASSETERRVECGQGAWRQVRLILEPR